MKNEGYALEDAKERIKLLEAENESLKALGCHCGESRRLKSQLESLSFDEKVHKEENDSLREAIAILDKRDEGLKKRVLELEQRMILQANMICSKSKVLSQILREKDELQSKLSEAKEIIKEIAKLEVWNAYKIKAEPFCLKAKAWLEKNK